MYTYGGLYLDLDMECFGPSDYTLGKFDVVLQGSGSEGLTNSVMASAPGQNVWLAILRLLEKRSPLNNPNKPDSPIVMTGPAAVRDAFNEYLGVPDAAEGYEGALYEVWIHTYNDYMHIPKAKAMAKHA